MKFYCDSCGAKYLIGDEKVRGKVLRIRCKKCEHVIVVREPTSPASTQGGSLQQLKNRLQAKGAEQADIPWYYSIAGKTFGPMPLQDLRAMFQSRELGDETYVWNETFDAWKPAPQCPLFVDLFQKGSVRKARNPTISLSTEDVQAVNQAAASLGGTSGTNILKRASRNTGLGGGSATMSKSGKMPGLSRPSAAAKAAGLGRPAADRPVLRPGGREKKETSPQERIRALRERLRSNAPGTKPGATNSLRERLRTAGSTPSLTAKPAKPEPASAEPIKPVVAEAPLVAPSLKPAPVAEVPEAVGQPESSAPMVDLQASTTPEGVVATPESADPFVGVEDKAPAYTQEEDATVVSMQALDLLEDEPAKDNVEASTAAVVTPEPVVTEPLVEEPQNPVLEEAAPLEVAAPAGDDIAGALEAAARQQSASALTDSASELDFFNEPMGEAPAPPVAPLSAEAQMDALVAAAPVNTTTGMFPSVPPSPDSAPAAGGLRPISTDAQKSVTKEESGMSASLLIQLNTLKKSQRSRQLIVAAAAFTVLLLVGVSGYILFNYIDDSRNKDLTSQAEAARLKAEKERSANKGDLEKRRSYKEGELNSLGGKKKKVVAEVTPEKVEGTPKPKKHARHGTAKPKAMFASNDKLGDALAGSQNTEEHDGGLRRNDGGEAGTVSKAGGIGHIKADPMNTNTSDILKMAAGSQVVGREKPKEEDKQPAALPDGLSKEAVQNGFKKVRRSVTQCVERHMKREGEVPKGKIKLGVTITNSGKVSAVSMDKEVRNTVFHSCMTSHKARWRFPAFSGDPITVRKPFVLK